MGKKRKAWIHVGAPGAGDPVEAALAHHHRALVELGYAAVARTSSESFLAAVELLRSHREWGLRRADVEGRWVGMVRRAEQAKVDLVFSQTMLADAAPEQVDLLVDALHAFRVQVVVSAGPGEEARRDALVARWQRAVRKPERLHVLDLPDEDPATVWREFGRLVGFGTASLGLGSVPPAVPPCATLADARREMERLVRRTASLELRLGELDRRRRRFRRTAA
ncbi:hypothetical protein E8D34_15905 [Nocardioides sp. GY 10113]|uniref:hypothetical protein n=1 Tax=Nocardioides sp. GY 10113 TaxID=2569761 RepID=UPI0010A87EE8|nr:hypothetical protein [Nocardioides sp. GY 10113]TIC83606.1 hypothetical protein E8D34_15905 [Nocardioides sp. GY 10113]